MVCDAIATVSAKVSNEAVAKLLTTEVIEKITPVLLQQLGYKVTRQYTVGDGKTWEFVVTPNLPSGRKYIRVRAGGTVIGYDDRNRTGGDTAIVKALAAALQTQGTRLLQRAVVTALQQSPNYQVTEAQEVRGAMVIKLDL